MHIRGVDAREHIASPPGLTLGSPPPMSFIQPMREVIMNTISLMISPFAGGKRVLTGSATASIGATATTHNRVLPGLAE